MPRIADNIRELTRYAELLQQSQVVLDAAQQASDIDAIVAALVELAAVRDPTTTLASSMPEDLATVFGVSANPSSLLGSEEELRQLVTSDMGNTAELVAGIVSLTQRRLMAARNEIDQLEASVIDVPELVASTLENLYLCVTGPFTGVPPVEITLVKAEELLAPLGLEGGVAAALSGLKKEDHATLSQNVEMIIDQQWNAWIMLDLREVTAHNREVWRSVPKGTPYDEARTRPTPHFECLVWHDAVLMRMHGSEFWLAPKLWQVLAGFDDVRSGTMQKVGNDVPAWERPKVVLLEGQIANEEDAALVSTYLKGTLGAGRKAVLRLREKIMKSRSAAADEVPSFAKVWQNQAAHKKYLKLYEDFIVKRHAGESLNFLKAVQKFRKSSPTVAKARAIYDEHIGDNSDHPINVNGKRKRDAGETIENAENGIGGDNLATVFDDLEKEVIAMLADETIGLRTELKRRRR